MERDAGPNNVDVEEDGDFLLTYLYSIRTQSDLLHAQIQEKIDRSLQTYSAYMDNLRRQALESDPPDIDLAVRLDRISSPHINNMMSYKAHVSAVLSDVERLSNSITSLFTRIAGTTNGMRPPARNLDALIRRRWFETDHSVIIRLQRLMRKVMFDQFFLMQINQAPTQLPPIPESSRSRSAGGGGGGQRRRQQGRMIEAVPLDVMQSPLIAQVTTFLREYRVLAEHAAIGDRRRGGEGGDAGGDGLWQAVGNAFNRLRRNFNIPIPERNVVRPPQQPPPAPAPATAPAPAPDPAPQDSRSVPGDNGSLNAAESVSSTPAAAPCPRETDGSRQSTSGVSVERPFAMFSRSPIASTSNTRSVPTDTTQSSAGGSSISVDTRRRPSFVRQETSTDTSSPYSYPSAAPPPSSRSPQTSSSSLRSVRSPAFSRQAEYFENIVNRQPQSDDEDADSDTVMADTDVTQASTIVLGESDEENGSPHGQELETGGDDENIQSAASADREFRERRGPEYNAFFQVLNERLNADERISFMEEGADSQPPDAANGSGPNYTAEILTIRQDETEDTHPNDPSEMVVEESSVPSDGVSQQIFQMFKQYNGARFYADSDTLATVKAVARWLADRPADLRSIRSLFVVMNDDQFRLFFTFVSRILDDVSRLQRDYDKDYRARISNFYKSNPDLARNISRSILRRLNE